MTKTYYAKSFGDVTVTEPGRPSRTLAPRLDLRNHSPTGFAWGYLGSGPAQLALAILCDCFGDAFAIGYYQRFKEEAIAKRPGDAAFCMDEDEIVEAMAEIEKRVM